MIITTLLLPLGHSPFMVIGPKLTGCSYITDRYWNKTGDEDQLSELITLSLKPLLPVNLSSHPTTAATLKSPLKSLMYLSEFILLL
jgi:hypothetical protein